jgi:hypothetical protein
MLQKDIGNKCDINLQNVLEVFSATSSEGADGGPKTESLVSYFCINKSRFIRK